MANDRHVGLLKQGRDTWNLWRALSPGVRPDLRGADLSAAYLRGIDLREVLLSATNLRGANLRGAELALADLRGADLRGADLSAADLRWATLHGADLRGADLREATLLKTSLERADLTNCRVAGISARDVVVDAETRQQDLVLTFGADLTITVDDLDVAQFLHLVIRGETIRHVLDAITAKLVLIFGGVRDGREAVRDALCAELRRTDLTPAVCAGAHPASRDPMGPVGTLARMARFIVVDLTDPSGVPHGLGPLLPLLCTTPVLPLALHGAERSTMASTLGALPWLLPTQEYADSASLVSALPEMIAVAAKTAGKRCPPRRFPV